MNNPLKAELQIPDPDAFYESLIRSHEGLSDEQSNLLNARLVLLMANQIGDQHVLEACIRAALDDLDAV